MTSQNLKSDVDTAGVFGFIGSLIGVPGGKYSELNFSLDQLGFFVSQLMIIPVMFWVRQIKDPRYRMIVILGFGIMVQYIVYGFSRS